MQLCPDQLDGCRDNTRINQAEQLSEQGSTTSAKEQSTVRTPALWGRSKSLLSIGALSTKLCSCGEQTEAVLH